MVRNILRLDLAVNLVSTFEPSGENPKFVVMNSNPRVSLFT